MTAFQSRQLAEIHDDNKRRFADMKRRGIRDEITTMKWPKGFYEVRGELINAQFGPGRTHATLAEIAKWKYGSGKLRLIRRGMIEGRPTATYEVI